jgi:ATP-binding cassette subfamily B protein/subfamily B ATP-binding cassette protein MsbA
MLAIVPVLVVVALFFGRRMKRNRRGQIEAQSRWTAFVHQTLTAIPLVQAFGTEDRNRVRFRNLAEDLAVATRRGVRLKEGSFLVNGLSTSASMAVILFVGCRHVHSGALSIGGLVTFLAYVQALQGALRGLARTFLNLRLGEAELDRVLEILAAENDVPEAPNAISLPGCVRNQGRRLRFEHVTFGYERGKTILREVSFEVVPGETIALVGPTGAGKSTLVSLVPRFFDPWAGRVLLDGFDVRDLKLVGLRAEIGIVLQEPFLLPMTAAENIAYGRPGVGRAEIEAAAAEAHADAFIRRLPHGYDSVLGERGAMLSVGERQRLSIARAFLKDAPVLILDEPTAALDAQSEASSWRRSGA